MESLLSELPDPRCKELLEELQSPLETATGHVIETRPQRKKQDSEKATPESNVNENEEHGLCASPTAGHDEIVDTPGSALDHSDAHGQLSVDACGHVRYLGRSSGFYLLQSSRTYHDGVFHFAGYDHAASKSDKSANEKVDPYTLPPSDLSSHLLKLYFDHFYPFLPLFYKKQLICPQDKTLSPLLLNSIYAVASRLSEDARVRSDPDDPDTAGELFYERAKRLLDDDYDVPRISTVQALILLSSHQQGASRTARSWLYSGMAFRMALDLGLNRDTKHWKLSLDEQERRKRVFWCCFMVDRLTSAVYGRSLTFDERDCDVPFPSEDDEEPLPCTTDDRSSARLLDVFVQNIKLCDILGHVLKNIYYAKSRLHISRQQIEHLLTTLHQQLTTWHTRLPTSLQYNIPNTEDGQMVPDPPYYVNQIHMLYHTCMILLHRSFIPGPMQAVETSFASYDICVSSARAILHMVSIMRADAHLRNVTSYAVYYAFTAGIIFIKMAASQKQPFAFDAKVNVNTIMRALEEMEKTWLHAGRCCNILGELAGLKDIKLVSDEYVPRRLSRITTPLPAIAVPNSPELPHHAPPYHQQPSLSTPSSSVDTNSQSPAMALINKRHDPLTFGSSPASTTSHIINGSTNDLSHPSMPSTASISMPIGPSIPITGMDPYAAPGSILTRARVVSPQSASQVDSNVSSTYPARSSVFPLQENADSFGTAFWGVPTSLDPEAWSQYFAQGASTPTSTSINFGNMASPSFDSQSLSNVAYTLFAPSSTSPSSPSPLIQSPFTASPMTTSVTLMSPTRKDILQIRRSNPLSPTSSFLFNSSLDNGP
ncbi:hypothetical protein DM01DRAFT_299698 [Hesseltinella vesiculosa]|uniref:Xylanolytic transcriptional activator regulatory domain-containing protein n=1 Tax=Hesseltinella vesiculosa TaxID=101127 RepID=A0A1X2G5F7_9FUNG|nr:hypothetical protein DM01DRAFT_299698 [Hesseltinella vesiculosa]